MNDDLYAKYAQKSRILVKFKTDSEKVRGTKTGRYKARDVVGLMVSELEEFLNARAEEYINERELPSEIIPSVPEPDSALDNERNQLRDEFVGHVLRRVLNYTILEILDLLSIDWNVSVEIPAI